MASDGLDVLPGTLEMLVLKTLAGGGELHGFAILDWIRDRTRQSLVIEEGALYPALHRMQKRAWLTSRWGVSDKGRRARYYRLTAAGREELRQQDEKWERYVEAVERIGRRTAEA